MGFLIIFGACVFTLGAAYAVWILVTKHRDRGTGNWPQTDGWVEAAFVYEHERETSEGIIRSYTPVVRYKYRLDGQTYVSKRRNFLPYDTQTFENRLDAETVVAKYTPDRTEMIPVYYNPNNPKQAVLELPKPRAHNATLLYGVTNVLCGIAMIVLGIVLS